MRPHSIAHASCCFVAAPRDVHVLGSMWKGYQVGGVPFSGLLCCVTELISVAALPMPVVAAPLALFRLDQLFQLSMPTDQLTN